MRTCYCKNMLFWLGVKIHKVVVFVKNIELALKHWRSALIFVDDSLQDYSHD